MKSFKIFIGIVLLLGGILSFFVTPIHFNLNNSGDLFNSAYWETDGASLIGNLLFKSVFLIWGSILVRNGFRK